MLVNTATFTNVSGALGILDKVRTTAVSWGWTEAEWRSGVVFDAATDAWVADVNGGYLSLTSPGFGGSQNLIAKLAVDKVSTRYEMQVRMCDSTAYLLTDPYHPVFTNALNPRTAFSNGWSLPTSNIPQIWIFGNAHYIFVVANLDGVLYTMMEFGSYAMRKTTPLTQNGSIANWTLVYLGYEWSEYADFSVPGVSLIYNIPSASLHHTLGSPTYWEDRAIPYQDTYVSVEYLGEANYYDCITPGYALLLNGPDASGRRFMMKNTFSYARLADGLITPVSESIGSLFDGFGLTPGQSLFYGTDEYKVFPACSINSHLWLAFRIV